MELLSLFQRFWQLWHYIETDAQIVLNIVKRKMFITMSDLRRSLRKMLNNPQETKFRWATTKLHIWRNKTSFFKMQKPKDL